MTITFPRPLPASAAIKAMTLELQYTQARAPTLGDSVQVANIAPDLWRIEIETVPLGFAARSEMDAWLASLRGGTRLMRVTHPLRRHVRAYRTTGYGGLTRVGGGAFDGTASLVSVGAQRDTLTMDTLPAGFAIDLGDLLSIGYPSGVQALHRVVQAGTASGAGAATVGVEPQVVAGATAGMTIALADAWCKAVLDPKSVTVRDAGSWGNPRGAFKFSAVQVYR